MSRLFLDMDGVLADFDKRANQIIGQDHYKFSWQYGDPELWRRLDEVRDFFFSMDPMPDAHELWAAVDSRDPAILTALPKTGREEVAKQKRAWIAKHFGSHVEVITCLSRDKADYSTLGSVLVDDRNIYRRDWEEAGGHFVHHTSAADTVQQLKRLGQI